MTRRWAAGLLACLVAGAIAAAQSSTGGASSTERIETGQTRSAEGVPETYRIRLLPVESFPSLPVAIADWLRQRGCMIPQTFEAQEPENVIQGAFRNPDSEDWAALCSRSGQTTLYVFFAGQFSAPTALRSQPDTLWLGHEPGSSIYGSAWGISTRTAEDLRASSQIRPETPIDHDAIEDADLERSVTFRYLEDGIWHILISENFR